MFNRMKIMVLVLVLGIFGMGIVTAGNVTEVSCTTREGCDDIIARPAYDCDELDGMQYMGSFWPQSRTANLQQGQKLSIRLGGPGVSFFDVTINGILIADDVVPQPPATVDYDVPASGTYTIVIEAFGSYDPGNNFTIYCSSGIDSYKDS